MSPATANTPPLNFIPVCLLGVDKRGNGLGIGLLDEILQNRILLKREKKAWIVVVSVADSVGSISPKVPFKHEGSGIPDDYLQYIISLKRQNGNLDQEAHYTQPEFLPEMVKQSLQPGMVFVDQMAKQDESKTLAALETLAEFGCSLVIAFNRSDEYKQKCRQIFGDRVTIFTKPPSVKKLLYSIVESYEKNPRRNEGAVALPPSPEEDGPQLEDVEDGHAHHDGCNHDHDDGHDHDHGHDHGQGHHGHVHHPGCNHIHEDDEEERINNSRVEEIMKNLAKNPTKAVNAIKSGNILFLTAVAYLLEYGTSIPEKFQSPEIPADEGYGMYLAQRGGLEALIRQTKQCASHIFYNTAKIDYEVEQKRNYLLFYSLRNMMMQLDETMARDFVKFGGMDLLRGVPYKQVEVETEGENNTVGAFRFPGFLRVTDVTIRSLGDDIVKRLSEKNQYLRKCDYCGMQEEKTGSWKQCAKCMFSVYCARECQVADWKDGGHKRFCAVTPAHR